MPVRTAWALLFHAVQSIQRYASLGYFDGVPFGVKSSLVADTRALAGGLEVLRSVMWQYSVFLLYFLLRQHIDVQGSRRTRLHQPCFDLEYSFGQRGGPICLAPSPSTLTNGRVRWGAYVKALRLQKLHVSFARGGSKEIPQLPRLSPPEVLRKTSNKNCWKSHRRRKTKLEVFVHLGSWRAPRDPR